MFRVLDRHRIASLAILTALGCGEPIEVDDAEEAISPSRAAFVSVARDYRRCIAPLCGGYWVQDLNRTTGAVYVSELDFSQSELDEATANIVRYAPEGELLLRAKLGPKDPRFNTRTLLVLEAYRGLPGMVRESGDSFYRVATNDPPIECLAAPCNNNRASLLNRSWRGGFTGVEPSRALAPMVDPAWVIGRVERHDALVAGHFAEGQQFAAGKESLLVASQVYLKLPDPVGPCPYLPTPRCPEGQVNVMSRTADRCLVPNGCVEPGACTLAVPACDEGYSMVSWTGGRFACTTFACDPSFLDPAPPPLGRCAVVRCAPGFHCTEEGADTCVPNLSCAETLCGPGTHCVEPTGGDASCLVDQWVSEQVRVESASPYANRERKAWLFSSDTSGTTAVRAHFARFDLEEDYDFVVIETQDGRELSRFTGRLGEFTTPLYDGDSLVIRFETDESVVRPGFLIDRIDTRTN